jgi:hypothetical protein
MSDDDDTTAARAERIQRRRTRVLQASGLLFALSMGAAVTRGVNIVPGALRGVDIVAILGMLAWGGVLLFMLATGGMVRKQGPLRDMLEDELTQAHRRNALMTGFWCLLIGVAAIYAVSLFTPIPYNAVAPALLIVAVAAPSLRFALLERRASRENG